MFENYALSSLQINNEQLDFDFFERKRKKRTLLRTDEMEKYIKKAKQRKKESKKRKQKKEREREKVWMLHIRCISSASKELKKGGTKGKKRKERKRQLEIERKWVKWINEECFCLYYLTV